VVPPRQTLMVAPERGVQQAGYARLGRFVGEKQCTYWSRIHQEVCPRPRHRLLAVHIVGAVLTAERVVSITTPDIVVAAA